MLPDGDIASPKSNTGLDPSVDHFTDRVVSFWQPPCNFSRWSPLSYVADDVSYSRVE